MNDPNGLIFWDGRYHMFYQYNPFGTAHANISWGHAVSQDLLHWLDLPIALRPTPGSVDEDGCYSGCAVVHSDEVYLIYSGVRRNSQRPCLAKAVDPSLVTFEKLPINPVIAAEPLSGLVGFRDHTVRRVDGEFRQLLGAGSATLGGCLLEYRSRDLVTWEYCGVFMSSTETGLPGSMWECPDLFCLDDRWFVVLSVLQGKEPLGVLYVEGVLEDNRFVPKASGRLDTGPRWYAPQSFDAPDGRRIAFGWLRERENELPELERSRIGVMSLPREYIAGPPGRLEMSPVSELQRLRTTPLAERVPAPSEQGVVVLQPPTPLEAFELEFDYPTNQPLLIELAGAHNETDIRLCLTDNAIVVTNADGAMRDFRDPILDLPGNEGFGPPGERRARLFYDGGICEVFTASGHVWSDVFYGAPLVRRITVRDDLDGTSSLAHRRVSARGWELASTWTANDPAPSFGAGNPK